MQIIHPLDAIRHAVLTAGGEIILPSPFRTKIGAVINKIIFRQNGDVNRPVVIGSVVFLGSNPDNEPGDSLRNEVLIQNMEELKRLRDVVCTEQSLTSRLDQISKYAFAAVKDALRKLGGSCVLEDGIPLVVDTCTDSGFVYHFDAKKVKLVDNRVLILREMDEENETYIAEGGYCDPDECWWEGSDWYAEWEGLLEVFDAVVEASETL